MSLNSVLALLPLLAVVGGVLWLRVYLPSYLQEKAKNLATKEDIGTLTHQVEGVKLQYQRAGAQFEAEFRTYQEIWERIVDVQRAALDLRPVLDRGLAPGETREDRKSQRLQRFADAFNEFNRLYWKRRPFYADAVFQELNELTTVVHGEAIGYEIGELGAHREYWTEARANAEKIAAQVERLCTVIRERLAKLAPV